jgi:uncharacterized protein (AIM24 family)
MQCHEVDYKIIGDDMQIVEIELDPGETVVAEAGAMNYMEDGITFEARMGDGSAAGEGFILQRLRGDGMAFIHAGGTVVKKTLNNETIRVDTGCLAAFTTGIDYSIESAGNLKSMFFGGEGFFLATLRGTGVVLLQSLPFSRMADRILQHAPKAGGTRKGEGSLLGSLGDLIDGDNR